MKSSQKGFSVVEILIAIIVTGLVGIAGWYVWQSKNNESASPDTPQTTQSKQDTTKESAKKTDTYQSKLYPSLTFTVPSGWQVNEPAEYDEYNWGAGSADSEIKVTKGETTLSLMFYTFKATGFEGYTCHDYKDLEKVGNIYRFTNKDGTTSYRSGISKSDVDEWASAQSQLGEFTVNEDKDPNYCVSFPYIATHKSTLNKKDYPDSPFNGVSTDVNDVLVWVSADVSGNASKELLADADNIISSFSDSVDW